MSRRVYPGGLAASLVDEGAFNRSGDGASSPNLSTIGTLCERTMIKLTRLGGGEFVLNAERIQYVEELPDTYITLVEGERVVVRESAEEVVRRVIDYQRSVRALRVFDS